MKILLVEDEKKLSDTIKESLEDEYDIEQAFDGEDAILFAKQDIYDVIILDLMLPIKNGYEVLDEIRAEGISVPVLILTAKDALNDKLKGFKKGADDYLTKPFAKEELKARIEAMIRRNNPNYFQKELTFKELRLNVNSRKAYIGDAELNLQGKQFDMLEYLLNAQNRIITKEQIFDKIWGFESETTANVVEVYASGIRKELKKFNYDKYFKTIRGVGYMLS
ncbi:MAG: response regulator transcription factor [Clostridia bacterium]|nr:response regulator transcription factor [Clostridia bacterium]